LKRVRILLALGRRTLSLNYLVKDDDGGGVELVELLPDSQSPDPELEVEHGELRRVIEEFLKELSPREERVLRLRFGLDGGQPLNLREIGERLGVSRERIRQLQEQAFRKLYRQQKSLKQLRDFI